MVLGGHISFRWHRGHIACLKVRRRHIYMIRIANLLLLTCFLLTCYLLTEWNKGMRTEMWCDTCLSMHVLVNNLHFEHCFWSEFGLEICYLDSDWVRELTIITQYQCITDKHYIQIKKPTQKHRALHSSKVSKINVRRICRIVNETTYLRITAWALEQVESRRSPESSVKLTKASRWSQANRKSQNGYSSPYPRNERWRI